MKGAAPGHRETEAALEADDPKLLRAELERLRRSEEMYRASARISGRLVWSADGDGQLTAISPIFEKLTGLEQSQGWLAVVHPDERERVAEAWRRSVSTGQPYAVEFLSLRGDGSTRMVRSRAIPIRDEDGRILRWYGSTEDIHEEKNAERARQKAEARLRESEELHRFTMELTRQIVWSVEPDGTGLTLSQRYYELTGMGLAEEPSLSIHPEDRERVLSSWANSLESSGPLLTECRLKTRDGDWRWFRVRAAPLRNEAGQILRWYGTSEDVHEEKLAEQARREAEERYRLAVQATNDAVWDYDLLAGTIDWSDNSAEIFGGYDPLGRTSIGWWEERIHADDRGDVLASLQRAIDSGQERWSASYRFRREDGSYADIFDRGFVIRDDSGRAVRAVGAMADLTERHRAEAELRRMQAQLIHVSRVSAMGTMASTLAHELNQPLAAVGNFLSGARRIALAEPKASDDLVAALTAAQSGVQRAGEIVRRLRELVAHGTSKITAEYLPRLIEEAGVLAFVDEELHGVRHRLELDPAAVWVRADRIQIQQVLINLIRNAIEAMEGSAEREIVLSTRTVGHELIEISIADTGAGIAADHLDTLFDQFMTTKAGGMGIGLPICRTIVEAHGGKITAENREAGGAVFRFTLPRAAAPAAKNGL